MGCITSRGKDWPPKPYKKFLPIQRLVLDKNGNPTGEIEEAYEWVYPGPRHPEGSGVTAKWADEASPGQEIAIRALEGN